MCDSQNNGGGRGNAGGADQSCGGTGKEPYLQQQSTSNKKVSRGRGRDRGRGVEKVERQLVNAQREHVGRQRQAQLERMQDLSPKNLRKRSKRGVMATEPTVSGPSSSVECRPADSEVSPPVDINAVIEIVALSTSEPCTIGTPEICDGDMRIELSMEEWLRLTDACNSDDDFDLDDLKNDDDPFLAPTDSRRNAAAEPACVTDLTVFQVDVLQAEDAASDLALRDIVTDDCYTFNWSNSKETFLGRRETFTGTSGPTFDVTNQTPIDIFDKMFDVDFIDFLCKETNRYAEQKIAKLANDKVRLKNSRFNKWFPTYRDEMITFLTIIILQGLYPLPEEEGYFTFNGFGTMQYFANIMSYNRFLLLKTMLHFFDSQTLQDTTRLCKIRPIIDYFNGKFSSLYMPSQEIAIDESLLKWHGRLSFSQKISSKAAKVGVKTYELCESSSGYLWKFFVYAGKDGPSATTDDDNGTRITVPDEVKTTDKDDDETNDKQVTCNNLDTQSGGVSTERPTNVTAKIVYDLIEPLLHLGHTLIMDNFYNSPLLLRFLKKKKTDCYGTLRLNREFVPDSLKNLNKTELNQGEVFAAYCSDLSVVVWRDANLVSMISTYHSLEVGTKEKYNKLMYKPTVVLDYNKNMGGVDRKDQYLAAQPVERVRNRVWYKKLFRRLYNAALFNCYVIFSTSHSNISHRKFRTMLAEDLLRRHRQIDLTNEYRRLYTKTSRTKQVTTKKRLTIKHRTQARPTLDQNHFPVRTGSRHTCCYLCPKTTRTIWKCEECDVNLCVNGCFKAYHKS